MLESDSVLELRSYSDKGNQDVSWEDSAAPPGPPGSTHTNLSKDMHSGLQIPSLLLTFKAQVIFCEV